MMRRLLRAECDGGAGVGWRLWLVVVTEGRFATFRGPKEKGAERSALSAGWLAVAVALVSHTSLLAWGNFEGTRRRRIDYLTNLFAPAPDTHGAAIDRIVDMDVAMSDAIPSSRETPQLLEEDALRHIARHVKSHIPGNTDANINEESL